MGRRLAAMGLARLGVGGCVWGVQGERPSWPRGACGSISHSRSGLCVALVGSSRGVERLGIDVEVISRLDMLRTELFTDAPERRQLLLFAEEGVDLRLWKARMFVAKEASWKALSDVCPDGRVSVIFDRSGSFSAYCSGLRVSGTTMLFGREEVMAIAWGLPAVRGADARWWEKLLLPWRDLGPYPAIDYFAGSLERDDEL